MRLVIDHKTYHDGADALFSRLIDTMGGDSVEIIKVKSFRDSSDLLTKADAVICRSNFTANAETLKQCDNLRFVGTATAGRDNLDVEYLDKRGIYWAYSPGCNADAVVDYVLSCLALTDNLTDLCRGDKSLGLVGYGEVGGRIYSRVYNLAQCLGDNSNIKVYDPFITKGFDKLDEVLKADIIVLVCSLTYGEKGSYGLFGEDILTQISPHQLLINCARGEIIDEEALCKLLAAGHLSPSQLILDVWANEPKINSNLVSRVLLATPHIAGYSRQGKQAAIVQVFDEFCHHFFPDYDLSLRPESNGNHNSFSVNLVQGHLVAEDLKRILLLNYDPVVDSIYTKRVFATTEARADVEETAPIFENLRNTYVLRTQGTERKLTDLPPASHYARATQLVLGQVMTELT